MDKISQLEIAPGDKQRARGSQALVFIGVILVAAAAAYFAWPRATDNNRKRDGSKALGAISAAPPANSSPAMPAVVTNTSTTADDVALTASGNIINRERIELSPRFMGTVTWIGVKKGDLVTNGQIVVRLDDAEYLARLHEVEGRLATAQANVNKAKLDYDRIIQLNKTQTESKKTEDDARMQLEITEAEVKEIQGSRELAQTYLDWTVIRSPIDGVVLEKLVHPNELVVPQSFGGVGGPSTALLAVADPKDLQVEVDLNETDLSKVSMDQKCRVTPEAYQQHVFEGQIVEIAPEANRQKETLQVKVQIHNPDHFLTPNLSAKVDFLKK